jgi:hypothetical protein
MPARIILPIAVAYWAIPSANHGVSPCFMGTFPHYPASAGSAIIATCLPSNFKAVSATHEKE